MNQDPRPVLVTGGAGFVGANLVDHLARTGLRVRIYDDLSATGADGNLSWLRRRHGDQVRATIADVRDRNRLRDAVDGVQVVFHLAAQVAVGASVIDPRADFEINALGTLDVLEAVRGHEPPPPVIFLSTSQVYGDLADLSVSIDGERWRPDDAALAAAGLDERWPHAPRTPLACSKSAADRYVLAHAGTFGVPAVVLRPSCAYGPRQQASDDPGWLAQLVLRAIDDQPITIHGDGRQVHDVLYVDDLIDACLRVWTRVDDLAGRAFNVGGGPAGTLSLRELLAMIEELRARKPTVVLRDWRPGDRRWYAADTRALADATGWRPRIGPRAGVTALLGWLLDQRTGRSQTLDNLGRIAGTHHG